MVETRVGNLGEGYILLLPRLGPHPDSVIGGRDWWHWTLISLVLRRGEETEVYVDGELMENVDGLPLEPYCRLMRRGGPPPRGDNNVLSVRMEDYVCLRDGRWLYGSEEISRAREQGHNPLSERAPGGA